jgi:hypothetical protein
MTNFALEMHLRVIASQPIFIQAAYVWVTTIFETNGCPIAAGRRPVMELSARPSAGFPPHVARQECQQQLCPSSETWRYHAFATELEQDAEAVLAGPKPKPGVHYGSNGSSRVLIDLKQTGGLCDSVSKMGFEFGPWLQSKWVIVLPASLGRPQLE